MEIIQSKQSNVYFVFQWILASVVGWIAAGAILVGYIILSGRAGGSPRDSIVDAIVVKILSWIVGSVITGITQWFVLRRWIRKTGLWILASSLGWIVGGAISTVITGGWGGSILGRFVSLTMSGIVVGMAQWLVLRGKIRKSGWWVLASVIGWILGGVVGEIVFVTLNWALHRVLGTAIDFFFTGQTGVICQAIADVVRGGIIGIITGVAFVWLYKAKSVN